MQHLGQPASTRHGSPRQARIIHNRPLLFTQVGAGLPPTLGQYMAQMASVSALHAAPAIFVAVGKTVLEGRDQSFLQEGRAPWGARLVRRLAPNGSAEASFAGVVPIVSANGRRTMARTPSWLDAAIVDSLVCRRARWFVGWSGSTFANGMAVYRHLEHAGQGYYAVCNNSITLDSHLRLSRCA